MNALVQIGERPATRGDCVNGLRPCPWASCQWHVAVIHKDSQGDAAYLTDAEVPDLETWPDTCILDVMDEDPAHPITLDRVGEAAGLTRERIRQIERHAMRALGNPFRRAMLREFIDGDPVEVRAVARLKRKSPPPSVVRQRVINALMAADEAINGHRIAERASVSPYSANKYVKQLAAEGLVLTTKADGIRGYVHRWIGGAL